jgi:hypothetical protein
MTPKPSPGPSVAAAGGSGGHHGFHPPQRRAQRLPLSRRGGWRSPPPAPRRYARLGVPAGEIVLTSVPWLEAGGLSVDLGLRLDR